MTVDDVKHIGTVSDEASLLQLLSQVTTM